MNILEVLGILGGLAAWVAALLEHRLARGQAKAAQLWFEGAEKKRAETVEEARALLTALAPKAPRKPVKTLDLPEAREGE